MTTTGVCLQSLLLNNSQSVITQDELSKVMDMLGEKLTPEEIKHMVIEAGLPWIIICESNAHIDSNGDGKIDFNEFRKVMFKP